MATQSSMHIEAGKGYRYLAHNDRSSKTKNSIFHDEQNEFSMGAKNAHEFFMQEIANRKRRYEEKKKRQVHKKTVLHLSSVVNLESHHTLQDLQPIIEHLEKTLGTKVFQVAIHRDEGHRDENGIAIKNYHAHIEFLGLDQDGMSVRRKLTRSYLSQLQSVVAHNLGMQRGTNYARERKPRPKRLSTYEYKRVKEAENREERSQKFMFEAVAELQQQNKKLREEMQLMGAVREDYARLETVNKRLMMELQEGKIELNSALDTLFSQKKEIEIAVEGRNKAEKALAVSEGRLAAKSGLEAKYDAVVSENTSLKEEVKEMESSISYVLEFARTAKKLLMKILRIDIPPEPKEALEVVEKELKLREQASKKKSRDFGM